MGMPPPTPTPPGDAQKHGGHATREVGSSFPMTAPAAAYLQRTWTNAALYVALTAMNVAAMLCALCVLYVLSYGRHTLQRTLHPAAGEVAAAAAFQQWAGDVRLRVSQDGRADSATVPGHSQWATAAEVEVATAMGERWGKPLVATGGTEWRDGDGAADAPTVNERETTAAPAGGRNAVGGKVTRTGGAAAAGAAAALQVREQVAAATSHAPGEGDRKVVAGKAGTLWARDGDTATNWAPGTLSAVHSQLTPVNISSAAGNAAPAPRPADGASAGPANSTPTTVSHSFFQVPQAVPRLVWFEVSGAVGGTVGALANGPWAAAEALLGLVRHRPWQCLGVSGMVASWLCSHRSLVRSRSRSRLLSLSYPSIHSRMHRGRTPAKPRAARPVLCVWPGCVATKHASMQVPRPVARQRSRHVVHNSAQHATGTRRGWSMGLLMGLAVHPPVRAVVARTRVVVWSGASWHWL